MCSSNIEKANPKNDRNDDYFKIKYDNVLKSYRAPDLGRNQGWYNLIPIPERDHRPLETTFSGQGILRLNVRHHGSDKPGYGKMRIPDRMFSTNGARHSSPAQRAGTRG
jgi:hypothetical protein